MKLPSPFPPISVYKTGQLRRQGSSMNSLRSALTTHLSGPGNLRSGRSRTTMAVLEIAKSVYHVPGTLWILCPGLDSLSRRRFGPPEEKVETTLDPAGLKARATTWSRIEE